MPEASSDTFSDLLKALPFDPDDTLTIVGLIAVAALALLRNVDPTLKAGLGGPVLAYLEMSSEGKGGATSLLCELLGVLEPTLTTAALPRMTLLVCAGSGETIAFLP